MIRAVIFDMFETLITLHSSPIYCGRQIAEDVGIPVEEFLSIWNATEYDRSINKLTFEDTMKMILSKYQCFSEKHIADIKQKRVDGRKTAFKQLHPEIIPMLSELKKKNILIGLISNTFSEEELVIRESIMFPYFDAIFLSSEQGVRKPDKIIYERCMKALSVKPEECFYIGDGGSYELEAAQELGMKTMQATWYLLKNSEIQPVGRKVEFLGLERPLDVLKMCYA